MREAALEDVESVGHSIEIKFGSARGGGGLPAEEMRSYPPEKPEDGADCA